MEDQPEQPVDPALTFDFLAGVYSQLPILVVRLTVDGIVVGVNPETERVTGYPAAQLQGKNWWGLLFPGKLFAQVPKFISPAAAGHVSRDFPLAMRTASGQVRVVAWTRFPRNEGSTGKPELVCLGTDITDRLLDADREAGGLEPVDLGALGECPTVPSEPLEMNDGTSFVEPLAVSPPAAMKPELWREAVEQAQAKLALVEERTEAIETLMEASDTTATRLLMRMVRGGQHERTLAPVWGRLEDNYRKLDEAVARFAAAEIKELGDLMKRHDRGV